MLVVIGDHIYDSDKQPLMVVLSVAEKDLISRMIPEEHKFCVFPGHMTVSEISEFTSIPIPPDKWQYTTIKTQPDLFEINHLRIGKIEEGE